MIKKDTARIKYKLLQATEGNQAEKRFKDEI